MVSILILGAGWTSTFLIPILDQKGITYAATSTTGRSGTYKFRFESGNSSSEAKRQFEGLPTAQNILITFPLKGEGQSKELVTRYRETHPKLSDYHFLQLGSSGIYEIPGQDTWVTRKSKYNVGNERAVAEDELLRLGGCVLNLSGLWGGQRNAIHWVERVASTKEMLAGKKSLHMVHGVDVARGIVAVFDGGWEKAKGERFILTDLMVYDWWALIFGYAGKLDEGGDEGMEGRQIKWVGELMKENGVRALPRSMEVLGRCYDTKEFWDTFGIMPVRSRI